VNFCRSRRALASGIAVAATAFAFAAVALAPQTKALAQTAPGMKPLAVVSFSSYDDLKNDLNFIGSLGEQPQLATQFEQMLMMFTQNKGLAGLDKTRPSGVVIQSDGINFAGAICLPVTSLSELLEVLKPFGVQSQPGPNGTLQITGMGQNLFAKEEGGWAFLSMMPQMLENLPSDPLQHISPLADEYNLGIRVHVQNVPEAYRQMAVSQLQAGMEAGLRPLPNESPEDFEKRKEMTTAQVEQLKSAINDMDELTVGLSIDSDKQRVLFDMVYTAVPDTQLAEQFAENSNPTTNFAGFVQPDAAMMMTFASKISESDVAQAEQVMATARAQANKAIDEEADLPDDEAREVVKSAVGDFMDAITATIRERVVDGGAIVTMSPTSATLVAGGFIGEPGKVESGLKKLAEHAEQQPDFPGVEWNVDNHSGVNFHSMNIPVPDEEEPRRLFGETLEVAIGIGPNSVYFAAGRDAIVAAKRVIDLSTANPNKPVPPMEMSVAVGQILDTVASFDKPGIEAVEMIAEGIRNEAPGRDHVRVVVQPIPQGARTRIELEEGVLRAIGMGVMAARMQAMAGQR
jgi:hypothetical protein